MAAFKVALNIVDVQEDFCPPNGSVAVAGGRDIVPTINSLLALPFVLKIATKDWHPHDHISFASNHPGKSPFVDTTLIINPKNPNETYTSQLWPDHCIQNTPGAELIPELHIKDINQTVLKGQNKDFKMYSAFYDPLTNPRCCDSGLASMLKDGNVTDVYVVAWHMISVLKPQLLMPRLKVSRLML